MLPGTDGKFIIFRFTPRAAPAPSIPNHPHPTLICRTNTIAEPVTLRQRQIPKAPRSHPVFRSQISCPQHVPIWPRVHRLSSEMLEINSGSPLWSTRSEQNISAGSGDWRSSGHLTPAYKSNPIALRPGDVAASLRPPDLIPGEKSDGQRCGMSSPLSSAQSRGSPPFPPPQSPVQLLDLVTGSLWGPDAGWSQRKGSPGRGSAPQEDSWPAGQWQFRRVNRPLRECLFFGGGGHEAGPQPRGKSLEFKERGAGSGNRTSRIH